MSSKNAKGHWSISEEILQRSGQKTLPGRLVRVYRIKQAGYIFHFPDHQNFKDAKCDVFRPEEREEENDQRKCGASFSKNI